MPCVADKGKSDAHYWVRLVAEKTFIKIAVINVACAKYNGRLPEYNISASGIMVLCKACDKYLELLNDTEDLYLGQSNKNHDQDGYDVVMMILDFCKEARSISEIMEEFEFDSRTSFRRKYLNTLVKEGKLNMTLPDKPKSKNQKYYS